MSKNVVAYLRVSSEGQSEDGFSLDNQIQKIKIYAINNNLTLKSNNIFIDVDSGSNPNRTKYLQMKEVVLNTDNKIEAVLVYAIDRWTRTAVDGLMLFKEFAQKNISLISVSEFFDTNTPIGKLYCGLLHLLAEFNKDVLIDKLTAGKKQMIKQTGKWAGGISPYGYRPLGKRKKRNEEAILNGRGQLLENNEETKIVQYIYYLKDEKKMSYGKICEELTAQNYYNRVGKNFNKATVYRILQRRDFYLGQSHINSSIELNDSIKPQQPSILNVK